MCCVHAAIAGYADYSSRHAATYSHTTSNAAKQAAHAASSEQYAYRTEASQGYQQPGRYHSIPFSDSKESGHHKQHAATADEQLRGYYRTAAAQHGGLAVTDNKPERATPAGPSAAAIQRLPFGRGAANTDSQSESDSLDQQEPISTSEESVLAKEQSGDMVPRSGRYRNDDNLPLEDSTGYPDDSDAASSMPPPTYSRNQHEDKTRYSDSDSASSVPPPPPSHNSYQHEEDANKGSSYPRYHDSDSGSSVPVPPPSHNSYQPQDTNKGSSYPRYDDSNSYKKGEIQHAYMRNHYAAVLWLCGMLHSKFESLAWQSHAVMQRFGCLTNCQLQGCTGQACRPHSQTCRALAWPAFRTTLCFRSH